ncbi:MAG: methylase [Coriobacteriia bacterium]|nr:methylase [Coriobacteriia bacterium]MCL2537193.1 methylase [Coriobacteriia bacterium]
MKSDATQHNLWGEGIVGAKTADEHQEKEVIIKCKRRVQKHGEVFTPAWMVDKMLSEPGIDEACNNLTATFLEPAAGEGAFLCEVLRRKLSMVSKKHNGTLSQYENYSLLALSTLYGVELLEDNAQILAINLFEVYKDYYEKTLAIYNKKPKDSVLRSAKTIIAKNVLHGDFLTQKNAAGETLILTEWKPLSKLDSRVKTVKVQRTEYSFSDIIDGRINPPGSTWTPPLCTQQLTLFTEQALSLDNTDLDSTDQLGSSTRKMRYSPSRITTVYKEEMEHYE